MALLFIVGVLLLGVAASLVLRVVVFPRLRVASQMRQIDTYGFGAETDVRERVEGSGLADLAGNVGRRTIITLPSVKPLARRELLAAGMYELTVDTFHGYRVLATLGLPALILTFSALGGSLTGLNLLLVLVVGAIAWFLPVAIIRTRGQRRLRQIDRDLPELIDVLTATIEAGFGFGGSIQLVAGRFDGPLGVELRLTQQEQTMGLSTEVALENMLDRCETPSVRSFVRAVLQGDSLGVSIGTTLRNLAAETRKRRRDAARERAQRAPVKLLFPLVFLIFPALLIVLMYPTVHNIVHLLGGGG
jgi:tight adherence protein C